MEGGSVVDGVDREGESEAVGGGSVTGKESDGRDPVGIGGGRQGQLPIPAQAGDFDVVGTDQSLVGGGGPGGDREHRRIGIGDDINEVGRTGIFLKGQSGGAGDHRCGGLDPGC